MIDLVAQLGALMVVFGIVVDALYDYRTRFVYALSPRRPRWMRWLLWIGLTVHIAGVAAFLKDFLWIPVLS